MYSVGSILNTVTGTYDTLQSTAAPINRIHRPRPRPKPKDPTMRWLVDSAHYLPESYLHVSRTLEPGICEQHSEYLR